MSNNKIKALVMAAAKKVCDDPRIDFKTVDGAKKALYNEIDRASSKILTSENPAEEFNRYVSEAEDALQIEDSDDPSSAFKDFMNSEFGDFMFGKPGDTKRFFEVLDEGCKALGIQKSPKGEVSLKGESARELLKYIAEHWNDGENKDDANSYPINITLF